MLVAAASANCRSNRGVPSDDTPSAEIAAYGRALRALRTRADVTVTAAAAEAGISRQAWTKYEAGETAAILRSDTRRRLAAAIGFDEEALTDALMSPSDAERGYQARARRPDDYQLTVLGRVRAGEEGPVVFGGGTERQIDMAWMFGEDASVLQVAGDSVTGRAESGQYTIADKSRWPRKGDLCVVHLKSGEMLIKVYEKADSSTLFVRQTFPEKELRFHLRDVQGVYLVRLVGE